MSYSNIGDIAKTLHSLSPEAQEAFSKQLQEDINSKTDKSFQVSNYTKSQAMVSLLLWENTLADSELEEECSCTALATLLKKLAEDLKNEDDKKALKILVRNLDLLGQLI